MVKLLITGNEKYNINAFDIHTVNKILANIINIDDVSTINRILTNRIIRSDNTIVPITYNNLSQLQTNNVYLVFVNNVDGQSFESMAIPSSRTSDSGGNGLPNYTSTEAFWYFTEIALENNDIIVSLV